MPRHSEEVLVREAVESYIAQAEYQPPEDMPLDIKHVARTLNVSRTTLYKYGLDEVIKAAAARQSDYAQHAPKDPQRRALDVQLRESRTALEQAEVRNQSLVAQLALVEANAMRLGIDPEELYKSVLKPIRSVSRAGTKGKRRTGR